MQKERTRKHEQKEQNKTQSEFIQKNPYASRSTRSWKMS